jgi:hypothetical protein
MSIYHTISDVQVKLKSIVANSSSIISDTELQKMCDRTEAVVSERFARKFVMPFDSVVNPNAFLIIQKICIALTANDAYQIIKLSSTQAVDPDAKNLLMTFYGEGKSLLDMMDKNLLQLSDATRLTDIKSTIDSSGSLSGENGSSGRNGFTGIAGEIEAIIGPPTPLSNQPVFNRRRRQW